MAGVVGLGRAIEWVGTYFPVAALLGMVVRMFAAFAVCLLLLRVASQGQGGSFGSLLSVSQE